MARSIQGDSDEAMIAVRPFSSGAPAMGAAKTTTFPSRQHSRNARNANGASMGC
jgi:hypothetical protein|tara:strand:- start:44 stop:205 length:162 start_codon:yes stop_codon:yes gene_type:complete